MTAAKPATEPVEPDLRRDDGHGCQHQTGRTGDQAPYPRTVQASGDRVAEQGKQHEVAGRGPVIKDPLAGPGRDQGEHHDGRRCQPNQQPSGVRPRRAGSPARTGSSSAPRSRAARTAPRRPGSRWASRAGIAALPPDRPGMRRTPIRAWRSRSAQGKTPPAREPPRDRVQGVSTSADAAGWPAGRGHAPPIVSTAEYLENNANPAHSPVAAHQPTGLAAGRRQRVQQTQRRPEQGGVQRSVGQHPGSGGHPEYRRKVQSHDRPEARPLVRDQAGDPPNEDLRQREQQDEWQADRPRRFGAEQVGGAPGEPPARRRMIEIAETQDRARLSPYSSRPPPARWSRRTPDGPALFRR